MDFKSVKQQVIDQKLGTLPTTPIQSTQTPDIGGNGNKNSDEGIWNDQITQPPELFFQKFSEPLVPWLVS